MGVFLKDIFDRMGEYIHKNVTITDSSPPNLENLLVYSAHDTNVASLLGALGAYEGEGKPLYASLVALELLAPKNTENESQYMLRLRYKRGWRDDVGAYVQFGACRGGKSEERVATKGCPFSVVRESIASFLVAPDEIETICKADWLTAKYSLIAVFFILIVALSCLVVVYVIVKLHQRRRQRDYVSMSNSTEEENLLYTQTISTNSI